MIVSRNSFNYKVYSKFCDYEPKNLCQYFWKSIFCYFLYAIIGLASLLIALTSLKYVNCLYNMILQRLMSTDDVVMTIGISTVLFIVIYAVMIWGLKSKEFFNHEYRFNYREMYKNYKTNVVYKEKCLLIEYIKAVKNKMCPIISIID